MSENLPTYRVTVTRDDGLWAAVVDAGLPPGVIGATDVEHFRDLDAAVRDLIAGLTDTKTSAFRVEWHYLQNGSEYGPVIEELKYWSHEVDAAVGNRDRMRKAAITSMRNAGLSLRDIADVLGISHQRVHQLQTSA